MSGPFPNYGSPDMMVLEGASALSPFRRERLESRLQSLAADLRITGAWHVYFIQTEGDAAPDPAILSRILEAQSTLAGREDGAVSRFVVPRLGTLSPWASKATEILRGAGLSVKRVERGTRLDLDGLPPADDPRWPKLARILHDPMTQSLLEARRLGQPWQPEAHDESLDLDDAYAVQAGVAQALGWFPDGPRAWKVGGTSLVTAAPLPEVLSSPVNWPAAAQPEWLIELQRRLDVPRQIEPTLPEADATATAR